MQHICFIRTEFAVEEPTHAHAKHEWIFACINESCTCHTVSDSVNTSCLYEACLWQRAGQVALGDNRNSEEDIWGRFALGAVLAGHLFLRHQGSTRRDLWLFSYTTWSSVQGAQNQHGCMPGQCLHLWPVEKKSIWGVWSRAGVHCSCYYGLLMSHIHTHRKVKGLLTDIKLNSKYVYTHPSHTHIVVCVKVYVWDTCIFVCVSMRMLDVLLHVCMQTSYLRMFVG